MSKFKRFVCLIVVTVLHISLFGETDSNQTREHHVMSQWEYAQQRAKDTVVQLFVDIATFNWQEPFKSPVESKAWGTGFFINDEGYLLSNFHVIDEAIAIKIQIPSLGKERFYVEVVGSAPERDITLLKLTEESLREVRLLLGKIPYLVLGDSDKVVRTQKVLALGYPLGQEKLKSTQGIVSGRENLSGESYIQVTAAINSGSSGGPSLNEQGEVIGITTASVTDAQNVGYVIPMNDVINVVKDLRHYRFLRKPLFGIELNNASKDMIAYFNNPPVGGYYISRVYQNTLFDRIGVQEGDMLYTINGHLFDWYGETNAPWSEDKIPLMTLLNRLKLGEEIEVVVYRNGQKKVCKFTFDLVDPLPIRTMYPGYEAISYEMIGGMVVMELSLNHIGLFEGDNPYLVRYKKRENQYVSRLIVTHIFSDSQIKKARVLKRGTILQEVNGYPVFTLNDFRYAVLQSDDFLRIKTEDQNFAVLSLDSILKEEDKLAERFFYKISPLLKRVKQHKERDLNMFIEQAKQQLKQPILC